MRVTDLSHSITEDMPVYPGDEQPVITPVCTLAAHNFLEHKITVSSHTGTHLDVPAHMFPGGASVDSLPPDRFTGRGVVLDVGKAGKMITVEDLLPQFQLLEQAAFVLLYTGWSKEWGRAAYFSDFPVLSPAAASWLSNLRLKGVGIDTISVDQPGSMEYPVHKTLLAADIIVIENLTNLESLQGETFDFFCFPLKFAGGDGSPVRAVAIQP
ncbi:MAG: cyclase family protein [Bacillota bacterium]|nr:cyclase family protein [Bacillota bacterium]MDW7683144.1 cyclase family protein [Bacillota bacterium]